MSNRLLTNDEVLLEIGVPMLRAMILKAAERFESGAQERVVVANPIADLMPVAFERAYFDRDRMLQNCDAIEAHLRERMGKRVMEPSDDQLITAMFDRDPAIGRVAKRLYDQLHQDDQPVREPAHCSECFEGCDKCQPSRL